MTLSQPQTISMETTITMKSTTVTTTKTTKNARSICLYNVYHARIFFPFFIATFQTLDE